MNASVDVTAITNSHHQKPTAAANWALHSVTKSLKLCLLIQTRRHGTAARIEIGGAAIYHFVFGRSDCVSVNPR